MKYNESTTQKIIAQSLSELAPKENESPNLDYYCGLNLKDWLEYIEGENKHAVVSFLSNEANSVVLSSAPGSRESHHAWQGGYEERVRQSMMIVTINIKILENIGALTQLPEEEQFTLSDALTVIFLHDIEKPFIYNYNKREGIVKLKPSFSKADRKQFRQAIIEKYGFKITATMANALKYVEGVPDSDYKPGQRTDQPLAALCHAADNVSARVLYSFR